MPEKKRRIWLRVILILGLPLLIFSFLFYTVFIMESEYHEDGNLLAQYFISVSGQPPMKFADIEDLKLETKIPTDWDAVCIVSDYSIVSDFIAGKYGLGSEQISKYQVIPMDYYIDETDGAIAFVRLESKKIHVYGIHWESTLRLPPKNSKCLRGRNTKFSVEKCERLNDYVLKISE